MGSRITPARRNLAPAATAAPGYGGSRSTGWRPTAVVRVRVLMAAKCLPGRPLYALRIVARALGPSTRPDTCLAEVVMAREMFVEAEDGELAQDVGLYADQFETAAIGPHGALATHEPTDACRT